MVGHVGPRPTVAANTKRYDGDATRSANDLDWTREIYSVITILYLDIGALEPLSKQTDPRRTLLHIVPWRKDGFDINYPDYTPAADAKPFIEKAKELGFRIMLHTNALGISETNSNYERFKPLQLKTPNTKELVGWLWDLEPGHIRRLAYINPASSEYRKLFIESIRPAIEELKPDALHLDAGGTIQNDGNGIIEGMNTIQGLIRYQQDLQEAFPGLALGYESITEINSGIYCVETAHFWPLLRRLQPNPASGEIYLTDVVEALNAAPSRCCLSCWRIPANSLASTLSSNSPRWTPSSGGAKPAN